MKSFSAIAVLATLTLSGCDLWFGRYHCEAAGDIAVIGLLDPYTGQCQYSSGGGGGTCGDYGGGAAEPAFADLAQCISECTGLAEQACLEAPGCRAGYVGDCPEGADCDNTAYVFTECWATAPSGPVQGECSGLDAYECSRHDDCAAHHFPAGTCDAAGCAPLPPGGVGPMGNFEYCAPEPVAATGCYSDEECPSGYSCDAAEVCDPPPGCTDPSQPCPAVCYGTCVPTPPVSSCYGQVLCDGPTPMCPAGTVPGINQAGCWSGECIAYSDCDPPMDPGTCYGQVLCDSLPPECPPGSAPGVLDGCWSGLCVPVEQCETPATCADAPSEAACIAQPTCAPTYVGANCTCDPAGVCTCERLDFDACVDA